jgi:predicted permease
MTMIALLITLGFFSYKKGILNEKARVAISAIIVNITNPCLMISSMLGGDERVSGQLLLLGLLGAFVTYAILIGIAELIPRIFNVEKGDRYSYFFLTLFGNIGFIGIPLTSAVLGEKALVYVCFHNLVFCFIVYTIGISKIDRAVMEQKGRENSQEDGSLGSDSVARKSTWGSNLKSMINPGTLAGVIALVFYVAGLNLPNILMLTIDYAGRSTTFLSMMVLGTAVAKMPVKRVVRNYRLITFSLVRLIPIPIIILYILKLFIHDDLILHTCALMLAVPAGNMPLIMATKQGLKAETISDGIVLSTVLSIITIPIVTLFV